MLEWALMMKLSFSHFCSCKLPLTNIPISDPSETLWSTKLTWWCHGRLLIWGKQIVCCVSPWKPVTHPVFLIYYILCDWMSSVWEVDLLSHSVAQASWELTEFLPLSLLSMHHECTVAILVRRGCWIPWHWVTDSCEQPGWYWEQNLDP